MGRMYDVPPVTGRETSIGMLLSMLDDGTVEWRQGELEEITLPDEAVIWQPFPGGHSIGAVILHIADVERFWLHQIAGGVEPTPEELALLMSMRRISTQCSGPRRPGSRWRGIWSSTTGSGRGRTRSWRISMIPPRSSSGKTTASPCAGCCTMSSGMRRIMPARCCCWRCSTWLSLVRQVERFAYGEFGYAQPFHYELVDCKGFNGGTLERHLAYCHPTDSKGANRNSPYRERADSCRARCGCYHCCAVQGTRFCGMGFLH